MAERQDLSGVWPARHAANLLPGRQSGVGKPITVETYGGQAIERRRSARGLGIDQRCK